MKKHHVALMILAGTYIIACSAIALAPSISFLLGTSRAALLIGVSAVFIPLAALIVLLSLELPERVAAASKSEVALVNLLIALNLFVPVASSLVGSVSGLELAGIFCWLGVMIAIQCLLLAATVSLRPIIIILLGGTVTALNSFALFFVFSDDYIYLPAPLKVAAIVAAAILGALFFQVFVGGNWLRPRQYIVLLSVVLIAGIGGAIVETWTSTTRSLQMPVQALFRTKPDVHVLTVESLQAPSLLQKHLELNAEDIPPYLAGHDVRHFKNVFTRFPSTLLSLNSFHMLDTVQSVENVYFSGLRASILTNVFRRNGYVIVAGYDNSYLGTAGPYVDQYVPRFGNIANSAACQFTIQNSLKFFGVCDVSRAISNAIRDKKPWAARYIEIMRNLPDDRPIFTFHHLIKPGHTGHLIGAYDHDDAEQRRRFKRQYLARLNDVRQTLKQARRILDGRNKPYILMVFGDHGIWLSREMPSDMTHPFVVQDRHGSYAAVISHHLDFDGCDVAMYSSKFTTPSRIFAGILNCLSGGKDMNRLNFIEPVDFNAFLYE